MSIALDASTPERTASVGSQSLRGRAYATDWNAQTAAQITRLAMRPAGRAASLSFPYWRCNPSSLETACLPFRFQLRFKIKTGICADVLAKKRHCRHNSPMFRG